MYHYAGCAHEVDVFQKLMFLKLIVFQILTKMNVYLKENLIKTNTEIRQKDQVALQVNVFGKPSKWSYQNRNTGRNKVISET